MSEDNKSNSTVVFKKKKKAFQIRKRIEDESGDSNQSDKDDEKDKWKLLDEYKELKKLKTKTRGVNITNLITTQSDIVKDTNKDETKFGGLTDSKKLANELDLGNTFSVETNRRDEDTDMMKYIEEELAKRKGIIKSDSKLQSENSNSNSADDVLFNILPAHLVKNNVKNKNEEMLSNQMLNGIPEVELGIEERIRNIEATEEAKMKLLESKKNKSLWSSTSTFVPTNIASCYVQQRFNIDDELGHQSVNKRQKTDDVNVSVVTEPIVVIGDEPKQSKLKLKNPMSNKHPGKDKASDDYIFEKFKKQFKK